MGGGTLILPPSLPSMLPSIFLPPSLQCFLPSFFLPPPPPSLPPSLPSFLPSSAVLLLLLFFVLLPWRRDGWGSSVLMLEHERGDPRRMFVGGVGGLYRVLKYCGQWSEGVRQVHTNTYIHTHTAYWHRWLNPTRKGCYYVIIEGPFVLRKIARCFPKYCFPGARFFNSLDFFPTFFFRVYM